MYAWTKQELSKDIKDKIADRHKAGRPKHHKTIFAPACVSLARKWLFCSLDDIMLLWLEILQYPQSPQVGPIEPIWCLPVHT